MQSSKDIAGQAAEQLGKQPIPVIKERDGYRLAPGALASLHAYDALKQISEEG